MKITVRRDDIKSGIRFEPYYCMVARAVQREVGENNSYVSCGRAIIGTRAYNLPKRVTLAVLLFDFRFPRWLIPTFAFDLPIPEPTMNNLATFRQRKAMSTYYTYMRKAS